MLPTLQPAGHILGSDYVEFKLLNNEIIVFSSDLGPSNTQLLPDPKPPKRADYLFIETTYTATKSMKTLPLELSA